MIDTKIACQCGHQFKFGMDLVAGRAPDGLACPTCGAPATAACNALVDFLSGREPAPPSNDTRPLKQIRVTCTCGARYKFDLELAEQSMPAPVVCPNCQIDLTPLANEEILSYVAKHSAGLATPVTAPAPVIAPPPEPAAVTPAAVTPAAEAAPARPDAAPTPATPEASPPPAASASAPPAPASPPPSTPAPSITPVSDPFGSPTGKSSGPNLKPLEVPKPNRPPPGSRPANPAPAHAPPAKPAAPAPSAAKHSPAKSAPHQHQHSHAHPAANAGEPSLGRGAGGAVGGALLGAAIWFALLQIPATPVAGKPLEAFPTSWMALIVGALAGFGARLLGRGAGPALGGAACGVAAVVCCLMAWLTMMRHIDRQIAPQLKAQYVAELANAQAAIKATDEELKALISRTTADFGMGGAVTKISDDEVKTYREKQLPKLRDFVAGKPSRSEWEAPRRARTRAGYPLEDVWQDTIGIFGLLFILAGIFAAAKIPMK